MENNKFVQKQQKKRLAARVISFVIMVLICIICTILPASAYVHGEPGYRTGLDLTANIVIDDGGYTIGPFDLVNETDDYTNTGESFDSGVNYGAYGLRDGYSVYKLYPVYDYSWLQLTRTDDLWIEIGGSDMLLDNAEWVKIATNSGYEIIEYYINYRYSYSGDSDWSYYEDYNDGTQQTSLTIRFDPVGIPVDDLFIDEVDISIRVRATSDNSDFNFQVSHTVQYIGDYSYSDGYNDGYQEGYEAGITQGHSIGYTEGFVDGRDEGYLNGYNQGYQDGLNQSSGNFDFVSWITNAVGGFFSFELFPGFSFGGVFGVILTICCVLAVLKFIAGG